MQKIRYLFLLIKKINSDKGFTIIEVLVSMFIFFLLITIVYLGLTGARRLIYHAIDEINFSVQLLQFDDYMRKEIQKIKIPFWIGKYRIVIDDNTAKIPYYCGLKDNYLFISFKDQRLSITSQSTDIIRSFTAIRRADLKIFSGNENKPPGIIVIIYGKPLNYKGIKAVYTFSSNPFRIKSGE